MIKKTKAADDLTAQIVELALDKKAENVISIDIKEITTLTDSFIICSADTDVQVKAISDNIRKNTSYKPFQSKILEIISPITPFLPCPIVSGPVGLALTNSTFAVFPSLDLFDPNLLFKSTSFIML